MAGPQIGTTRYPEDVPENELRSIRLSLSLSQVDLMREIGKSFPVGDVENGVKSPLRYDGEPRAFVAPLLRYLGCEFSDVFPREVCRLGGADGLVSCQHEGVSRSESKNFKIPATLRKAIAGLPTPRLKRVLLRRVCLDWTLEEVGAREGVSKERVRQLESKALRILRGRISPKDYL